jgi:GT2 family glycosyltransferase
MSPSLKSRTPEPSPATKTYTPGDQFVFGEGEPGLVSVIVPTYNRAELIRITIDSILAQTYGQVEVIIADDGSKDHTREVIESYDARVRYFHQPNAGVSAARNLGLRQARGEFIALLDSDDSWLPWKLEAQVRLFRAHPEVGMIWTNMIAVDEDGVVLNERYLREFYDAHALAHLEDVWEDGGSLSDTWKDAPQAAAPAPFYKGDIFSQMLLGNLVHTSTVVLRRERLRQVGDFDVSLLKSGEDYEFHLRTCSFGPVGLLDASSILYRVGAADQLTAPHLGIHRARNNLTTVLRWLERGQGRITLPERVIRDRIAQCYGWVGEAELEFGAWSRARKNLWRSLRGRPAQRRAATLFLFTLLPRPAFKGARKLKHGIQTVVAAVSHLHFPGLE